MIYPQAILGVYDFLSVIYFSHIFLSDEYKQSYIKKMSLRFIGAVNGDRDFEAQKSASIHHKKCSTWIWGVNKGLLKQSDAFVWEKYPYLKLNKL